MNANPPDGERLNSNLFLRRFEQPAIAVVLCACLILTGLFVFRLWRTKQGVIDIDDRPFHDAQLYVDLNSAPWPEFANLPGIGESLGRMIVNYRQQHGRFRDIEEVKLVPGIGDSRFRQMKRFLVIAEPVGQ